MGLFDIFKKDRGYDIHSLEFCEVGKDGKRETRPSLKHYTDSRYIMPVVKMTSRIDRAVKIKVRITEPGGKVHMYDFDAPLKPRENMSAYFPWWGSEKRDRFTTVGTWQFDVLDEDDQVVIGAPLEIVPVEDIWEGMGWIHVTSHLEFRNIDYHNNAIDDWGTKSFVEPQYIQMRCGYTCYSKVEREITYDVRIENLATGKTKEFNHTVKLDPRGGWLQMCGWGNNKGTSYAPGKYVYRLYYRGTILGSGNFEVVKSPRQRGWIEPVSLVLYCCNTEDEISSWKYDYARTLFSGKHIEQQSFKGSYNILVAGFQYRSLESGHSFKLKYKFYVDGNLWATQVREHTTGQEDWLFIAFSSGVAAVGGAPLNSGRYLVEVYLETDDFEECCVSLRAISI